MNKLMAIYDGIDSKDTLEDFRTFKTSIDVKNLETGEYIFKGLKNKVIIPGSAFIADKLFDNCGDGAKIPTYDDKIEGLDKSEGIEYDASNNSAIGTIATSSNNKILLFCCGTDGCGEINSSVYPVNYQKWIAPENLVPFRFPLNENDISDTLRETYFGRASKTLIDANGGEHEHVAYYFKRFEDKPTLHQQYANGTVVGADVYESSNTGAETFVEIKLVITKDDIREYFIATKTIDDARINSISLCSAYPVEVDGINKQGNAVKYTYFKNIQPITKLNFPNEQLIDITKGIEIIYHIYM